MNIEHANRLIAHLEGVAQKDFNMNVWLHTEITDPSQPLKDDGNSYRAGSVINNPEYFGKLFREHHTCNTVGCIAGHAVIVSAMDSSLSEFKRDPYDFHEPTFSAARAYLDISFAQAMELFKPEDVVYYTVTPARAVMVLQHFVDTGNIDWSIARDDFEKESVGLQP